MESFQQTFNSQEHIIEVASDQIHQKEGLIYPSSSQNMALYDATLYAVPVDSEGASANMVGTIQTSKSQITSNLPKGQETDPEEDYTPDSEAPSDVYE